MGCGNSKNNNLNNQRTQDTNLEFPIEENKYKSKSEEIQQIEEFEEIEKINIKKISITNK